MSLPQIAVEAHVPSAWRGAVSRSSTSTPSGLRSSIFSTVPQPAKSRSGGGTELRSPSPPAASAVSPEGGEPGSRVGPPVAGSAELASAAPESPAGVESELEGGSEGLLTGGPN